MDRVERSFVWFVFQRFDLNGRYLVFDVDDWDEERQKEN